MARLLPENEKRKLGISKSEAAGIAATKLDKDGRLSLLVSSHYLGVSVLTIRDHVSKGRIYTTSIGAREYIEEEDLKRLKELLDVYGSLAIAFKAEEAQQRNNPDSPTNQYRPFDEEY